MSAEYFRDAYNDETVALMLERGRKPADPRLYAMALAYTKSAGMHPALAIDILPHMPAVLEAVRQHDQEVVPVAREDDRR